MAELSSTSLFSDPSLKAYYKLEDVADSVGTYTLTNNNSVTFVAAKFTNGAEYGTANTNKFLNNASLNLSLAGSWSISLWVKMNTEIGAGKQSFAYLGDNTNFNSLRLLYNYNAGTPRIDFIRREQQVSNDTLSGTITLGTTTFHHIVFNYDTTNIIGYINGTNQGTVASSGNGAAGPEMTEFDIGREVNDGGGTGNFASAVFDDIGVFTRTLTAGEVSTLFNPTAVTTNGLDLTSKRW